jgi:hypothetical protein
MLADRSAISIANSETGHWDPQTRAYLARRMAQGKTRREALRCLKRYIAREIYQIITQPRPHSTAA